MYPALAYRSVDDVRVDWENVSGLLAENGVKCGLLLYDMRRHPAKDGPWYRRLLEFEVVMHHTLASRGWPVFPMPPDAPAADGDAYWGHYRTDWNAEFISNALLNCAVPKK